MAPFHAPGGAQDQAASRLLLVAIIIAGLYLGRGVLAPLALALLLTIAALPVADWLQRRHVPRLAAALLILAVVVAVVLGLAQLVVTQAYLLLAELPRYETELRSKLSTVAGGSGPITEVIHLIERLGASIAPDAAQPVVMAAPPSSPFDAVLTAAQWVLGPLAMLAITLLLMAFLLVEREHVRDRALRLAGADEMPRTTRAMQEATHRVGRFLLMQMLVNGCFGAAMGLGLWALGVPNAPLWGVLCFALRFVPFLGAPLSALFPLTMAFATTPGWSTVLLVLVLFAVVDLAISYVLEPWALGASVGITPLALVLSSLFWGALWGPVGLILTPALTACLVVLGRHLPGLGFLDVMLSDRAALSAAERFYQRLLAGDGDGAARLLTQSAAAMDEQQALQTLAEPALQRIATERDGSDHGPALAVRSVRALLAALDQRDAPALPPDIAVLPMAGALDRAAAMLLVAALQEAGQGAAIGLAPGAARVVVVSTGVVAAHRSARMLAGLRRAGLPVIAYAPADAAQGWTEAAGLVVAPNLASVFAALEEAPAAFSNAHSVPA